MNIKTQICGILVLTVICLIYSRKRILPSKSREIFNLMSNITFFCILFDILSIVAIVKFPLSMMAATILICKVYLILLVLTAYMGFIYICSDIYRDTRIIVRIISVIEMVLACVICILPIDMVYSPEENYVYTHGLSVAMTYVAGLISIVSGFAMIIIHGKKMISRRRNAIFIWLCMWVGCSLFQMIFYKFLIVGFGTALAILIVYLQFENPELNYDRTTGLFNHMAYMEYCKQLFQRNINFYVVAVSFVNEQEQLVFGEHVSERRNKCIDKILEIEDAKAFKMSESLTILIFSSDVYYSQNSLYEGMESLSNEEYSRKLLYYVDKKLEEDNYLRLIGFPDISCAQNGKELQDLVEYAVFKTSGSTIGRRVIASRDIVDEMLLSRHMINQLISALSDDRIKIYYQPIYSVKEKKYVSAEALVRLIDEEGNIVFPLKFIEIAERTGLINELGEMVFDKVCDFEERNDMDRLGLEYIEVNLSVIQGANPNMYKKFIEILKNHKIDPGMINLEITESASIAMKQILLDNMNKLINYGTSFSLDDFGTGHSNLNYMVDMPVEIVKFDREMTQAYFESGKAKHIVEAAIRMIKEMGLKIVAEGVETKEQLEGLTELGVDYIQGYFFSKPIPEEEFVALIEEFNLKK